MSDAKLIEAAMDLARILRAEPKMNGSGPYHLRQLSETNEVCAAFHQALAALPESPVIVPRSLLFDVFRNSKDAWRIAACINGLMPVPDQTIAELLNEARATNENAGGT